MDYLEGDDNADCEELEKEDVKYNGELFHIGIIRRSGRYPWGSGNNPYQRSKDFRSMYEELKAQGLTQSQIAEGLGLVNYKGEPSTDMLRAAIALSTEQIRDQNIAQAMRLRDQMSTSAVARAMDVNESTVRGWLAARDKIKEDSIRATAEKLKQEVEEKGYLDVGKGNHLYLGVSDTKFRTALAMLNEEGYNVYPMRIPQLGTDKLTNYRVLTKPGTEWGEMREAVLAGKLKIIGAQSDDGGLTFKTPKAQPVSVDLKRVDVRWDEDGGTTMDGVIELRRGVPDLDLGASKYAQVRIAINGTHYLKGMAMYADDLPAGVDMRFNTNKSRSTNKLDAMKELKNDPENRFGATVRPKMFIDKDGKEKTSPLNVVYEEGKWDEWTRSLSSQMLSKQSVQFANTQLAKARQASEKDLDKILAMTNPVVRKKLLDEYADSADAAAVHLKAAQIKRQATKVILPINSMRPNEVYAPGYDQGEMVALVRHPHGGPFEIPNLRVNNSNAQARRILKNAADAIGIHHSVASQLSGADFDGDTVILIPNSNRQIKTRPPFRELQSFDPKIDYKISDDDTKTVRMTKKNTQTEMGKISNLITDMSIHGASDGELIKAVKHSMVVIDAEKHGLDYKRSEQDQGIKSLKVKYQGGAGKGAATIISRASSPDSIPKVRQPHGAKGVNPKTGEKILIPTGESYVNKQGKTVVKKTFGTKMEFTKDARKLMSSSPQPMEKVYADHANAMKSLANQARKASVNTQMPRQNKQAKVAYANEVRSLDQKLKTAQRNAPLERRAQAIGGAMTRARIDANPGLDKDDMKKIKYQSLEDARQLTGANKEKVRITDREWQAIQSGAVSPSRLREILNNADMDRVKELASPRGTRLTPGQLARARALEASGKSMSEIAEKLGIPRTTLRDNISK